jgi:hypothetical protein
VSRELAKDQTQELHRARLPISGLMPPSPRAAEPVPPAKAKAPLSSRHTPLSADDIRKGIDVRPDDRPTHRLAPQAFEPPPTPVPGSSGEVAKPGLTPLPPPPPGFEKGLLSNLFEEDEGPRFTPISRLPDPPTGSVPRPQFSPATGYGDEKPDSDPGSTPLPGAEPEGERGSTDEIPIKWKIF